MLFHRTESLDFGILFDGEVSWWVEPHFMYLARLAKGDTATSTMECEST